MGYLNPGPDDEYRIASQAQNGTTDVPGAEGLEGLATAIPKGFVSGLEKIKGVNDAMVNSAASAADEYLPSWAAGAYHAEEFLNPLTMGAASNRLFQEADPDDAKKADAAQQVIQQWSATGQDPRETGSIGRIASSVAENLTIATPGAIAGGPWGAAALLGSTQGYSDYLQNKQDGLDDTTALEKAGLTGGLSAAGAFIPMKFGNGIWTSLAGGTATNLVAGAAQRASTAAVLDANGYHDMAKQYRVFDGESVAADAILGLAFGGYGHYAHPRAVLPADVDAAAATASEDHFNRSAPGVPTSPDVANDHVDVMHASLDALAKGDIPDVPASVAQNLVDNTVPDPMHDALPPIVEAAPTELPGYEDAARPIDAIEPPARELGEPMAANDDAAEFPPLMQARVNALVQQYGDLPYIAPDGTPTTYRQQAETMRAQLADTETASKLTETAIACFLRTGGAA